MFTRANTERLEIKPSEKRPDQEPPSAGKTRYKEAFPKNAKGVRTQGAGQDKAKVGPGHKRRRWPGRKMSGALRSSRLAT